jgi:hypothetical protein
MFMKDFYGKTVSRMLWVSKLPAHPGYFVGLREQRKRPNRSERIVHEAATAHFTTQAAAVKFYNRFNTKEKVLDFLYADSEEACEARLLAEWYHANKPSADPKGKWAIPKLAPSKKVLKTKAPKQPASFRKALKLGLIDKEGNFLN